LDRRWTFWIDRGGTFTDVVGRTHDGREATAKLLSVSSAWADSAVEGMRRLMDLAPGAPFPGDRVEAIRMGTTVATNALLERRFARTLLVTTRGFADALRIGDQARPDLFALDIRRPEPLFAGVLEADERLAADGSVVEALDPATLGARLAEVAPDYDAVAVAFLHSDLNPVHERLAGRLARAAGVPFVALSHEVSPLPRFLPRAETTVADACLTPVLRAYVDQVQTAVGEAPLWFMTSAGGLVRASAFRGRDAETVAAGGGSILHFDGDRARAGPASAGADPGPAAYGRGGPATVTDANLVLGRLDPARFPAVFGPEGRSPLDAAAAQAALSDLAARMGLAGPEAAAEGFLAVAVEQTAQAVRRISTERGFDPREHALVAFGGAAGQVACDVAEALGIDEVLCPGQGSVLSAWGMGQARPTVLRQAGLEAPLDGAGLGAAADLAERLGAEALAGLSAQGIDGGEVQVRLGLRYDGADAVLAVAPGTEGEVREAFEAAHRRLFGFTETDRAVLVARVEAEAVDATLPPCPRDAPATPVSPLAPPWTRR